MMICIIMYKYAFVNSFLNIFVNLCILSLVHIYIAFLLCIITNFYRLTIDKPPDSGRCARVLLSFYALSMHNILIVMIWTQFHIHP